MYYTRLNPRGTNAQWLDFTTMNINLSTKEYERRKGSAMDHELSLMSSEVI